MDGNLAWNVTVLLICQLQVSPSLMVISASGNGGVRPL